MSDRRENWPKLSASFRRFEISLRKILWLMIALAILGSVISGCSPFYVIRAAYEEGKILWRREPIPQYLEKAAVGPDTQDKLKLVLAVREYAPVRHLRQDADAVASAALTRCLRQ